MEGTAGRHTCPAWAENGIREGCVGDGQTQIENRHRGSDSGGEQERVNEGMTAGKIDG